MQALANANHLLNMVDQPLQPGEMELINSVGLLMVQNGFTEQQVLLFKSDPNIQFAQGKNNNVQRYKINVYLNTQYLMVAADTQNERSLLLDSGNFANWTELFQTVHMPAMKAYGLPRAYPVV